MHRNWNGGGYMYRRGGTRRDNLSASNAGLRGRDPAGCGMNRYLILRKSGNCALLVTAGDILIAPYEALRSAVRKKSRIKVLAGSEETRVLVLCWRFQRISK